MFTGLVEEVGRIRRIEERSGGRRIRIAAQQVLGDLRNGDSVAVDGCCLTVAEVEPGGFVVDVVPESIQRTTLGARREDDPVNLERSLRWDQRLGGHLVQGHVDGVGEVTAVREEGEGRRIALRVPDVLARFVAEKGSIAVDGVSLTVASCSGSTCEIALIPHTLERTVAGRYQAGRRVNLEVDLLARYVARLLEEVGVTGRKAG
jgi:riboflavin synthase